MYFLLFFILGFAQAQDEFYCRLRITNVSSETAALIRSAGFDVRFGNASSTWQGSDVGDDPSVAEGLYRVFAKHTINDISYPSLNSEIQELSDQQISIRCSRRSNNTRGIIFRESFNLDLGSITIDDGLIKRQVEFQSQEQVDCFDKEGFIVPDNLDPLYRYVANGERYAPACSSVRFCENGNLSAVSRCPPFLPSPKYAEVREVGECCYRALSKADIQARGCPKDKTELIFDQSRRTQGTPVKPISLPWQVRFQNKDGDSSQICDGVIVHKNWFLTDAQCLKDVKEATLTFSRPYGTRHQRRNSNVTVIAVDTASNDTRTEVALVRITPSFISGDWTETQQSVNLPWNEEICEKFLEPGCQVIVESEKDSDPNVISGTIDSSSRSTDIRIQTKQTSPVLAGSGIVSWYHKAYFLVGIFAGGNTAKFGEADKNQSGLISICPYLETIQKHIGEKEKK